MGLGSLFSGMFGRKPAPQRGPSVMGKGGGWVPPDNPDAVNDPMQHAQEQPMGQLGSLVNPGGAQYQPYNPPPQGGNAIDAGMPQGGAPDAGQSGGNAIDAGMPPQGGNIADAGAPPQGGNLADFQPPQGGIAYHPPGTTVQGPEGGAPPPPAPPQFGSVMGQHEWVNRGINPNGGQFDPRTGAMTPPRGPMGRPMGMPRRRPVGMLGDLMNQRRMR